MLVYNDHMYGLYMSDFEKCLNQLQLDLIILLVNLLCKLGRIITRYDFLQAEKSDSEHCKKLFELIISPNEVFGDIMVLASPSPPCPPVDPDDVNALNIQWISFKVYMRVDTP